MLGTSLFIYAVVCLIGVGLVRARTDNPFAGLFCVLVGIVLLVSGGGLFLYTVVEALNRLG